MVFFLSVTQYKCAASWSLYIKSRASTELYDFYYCKHNIINK